MTVPTIYTRRATLLLIVCCAAALRFWSLGAGIPDDLNIDEPQIMSRSSQMLKSGDFNPHFFDYPGLYIHLQMAVACVRFLHGATRGEWSSLEQVGMQDFFLWGRAVTALFGTATVLLVYLAGRRWGTTEALAASALMAVMPSAVRESHFILTDTPATFFVAATLVVSLAALERERLRTFAAAGALAGLAAATKYNAGLVILVPLIAALFGEWRNGGLSARLRPTAAIVASAAGAFLAAAPYTVLALPEFLNGFAHLASVYVPGHSSNGAVIYLKHLRLTLGWVASVLAVAGLIVAATQVVRSRTRAASLCLTMFPVLYFLMIADRSLIFGRYLLPILPFVALLTGLAVGRIAMGAARIRRPALRFAVVAAVLAATLIAPARQAIAFDRGISVVRTPGLAYQWIAANVPRGASVAVEMAALTLPGYRFRVRQISRVSDRPSAEIFGCYDYVVAAAASYAPALRDQQGRPDEHAAYADLFLKGQQVASFAPSPQHPGPELVVVRIASKLPRLEPCP